MPGTFTSLHYHLVFSTKNREPVVHGKTFAWQEGYAAFSVSPTSREGVRRYLARQRDHHRVTPFREELEEMLRKAGVTFKAEHLD